MQSQDVLQRALIDYPGSVMIVSHNRNFLDPLVTKTLEFQPGRQPIQYAGNITYYLEKSAEDEAVRKGEPKLTTLGSPTANGSSRPSTPGVSRKEQRRLDAEAREIKSKVLKPLEAEFEALEKKIAELEGAQQLSSEAVTNDPAKLREVTNAVEKIAKALEASYFRWGELSDEIDKVKAKLGIEA
jgi:ATP-binding cassette subfamily F protein 3